MDTQTLSARLLAGVVLLSACGSDIAGPKGKCSLAEGDLVMSEIMTDPTGESKQLEWIEIYNTTSKPIALSRVLLTKKSTTAKEPKTVQLKNAGEIAPNDYFVLGASALPFVDYVYGTSFELTNTGGMISIGCDDTTSDIVLYGDSGGAPKPPKGVSISFDGGVAPDAMLNDTGSYWCVSKEEYDGTNLGTPGAPNTSCGVSTCTEPSGERQIIAPKIGDLLVVEALSNPSESDTGREWIELYVASDTAVDVNSLEVIVTNARTSTHDTYKVASTLCLPAQPGDYVVLGASDDFIENGGVNVDFLLPGLTLPNSDNYSIVLSRGLVVIDTALVPTMPEGVSARLDESLLSSVGNDDVAAFCAASTAQIDLFADKGTPGAANGICGFASCQEGSEVRAVSRPGAGDLLVSELLAEPVAASGGREWIELYVAAEAPVDLNGLVLRSKNTGTASQKVLNLAASDCMRVEPGSYVVLAGPENAGASQLGADFVFQDLSFFNDVELFVELYAGDTLIDSATVPASASAASQSVAPSELTATGNDVASAFCTSSTSGVFEEKGTPGYANICGASCVDSLGQPRVANSPAAGDVIITEILANARTDASTAADNGRDWVEIYVSSEAAVDLNGVKVVNTGGGTGGTPGSTQSWTLTSTSCLTVEPGTYAVIGGFNVATQGITPIATIGTSSASLFYASGTNPLPVLALDLNGEILSSASYGFQDAKSYALDDDNAELWCNASAASEGFTGGMGSPGVANPSCD